MIVNDAVILELKSVETINDAHSAQLINNLKAIDIEVRLILNFGLNPQIARKIYDESKIDKRKE